MALRAHTSEAVSPKAVQPKELPPSYLLFDGQWQQMDIHPVITYNIEDSVVKRSDGVELSLTARYRPSSFHCTLINGSGDTVCSGLGVEASGRLQCSAMPAFRYWGFHCKAIQCNMLIIAQRGRFTECSSSSSQQFSRAPTSGHHQQVARPTPVSTNAHVSAITSGHY